MLPEKLKALRKEKGWTQKKAASECLVSRPAWGSYEEGRATPSIQTLKRIREIFGLNSVEALIE